MYISFKFPYHIALCISLFQATSIGANSQDCGTYEKCPYKNRYLKAISILEKPKVNGIRIHKSEQITELKSRFFDFSWIPGNPGYEFEDWNQWRKKDGLLCRNDGDCKWLGSDVECQIVAGFDWQINKDWYGGNDKPRGECGCNTDYFKDSKWNNKTLQCDKNVNVGLWIWVAVSLIIIFLSFCIICSHKKSVNEKRQREIALQNFVLIEPSFPAHFDHQNISYISRSNAIHPQSSAAELPNAQFTSTVQIHLNPNRPQNTNLAAEVDAPPKYDSVKTTNHGSIVMNCGNLNELPTYDDLMKK